MRKFILIILLSFIGCFYLFGQESKIQSKSSSQTTVVRLSFLPPSLIIDQKLTKKITFRISVWEGFNFSYINYNEESFSSIEFWTYLTVEPRFHTIFNLGRIGGGNTGTFWGSYVGIPITLGLTEECYSIGLIYGFQKMFGKRGFWNLGLGFGDTKYKNEENFGLIGDFGLGIILN